MEDDCIEIPLHMKRGTINFASLARSDVKIVTPSVIETDWVGDYNLNDPRQLEYER